MDRKVNGQKIKVSNISHDEMETKVRQHRKFLKQSEFLKRQAAKERQQANAESFKGLVEKVKEKMAEEPTHSSGTPDDYIQDMNESSSAVIIIFKYVLFFTVFNSVFELLYF